MKYRRATKKLHKYMAYCMSGNIYSTLLCLWTYSGTKQADSCVLHIRSW